MTSSLWRRCAVLLRGLGEGAKEVAIGIFRDDCFGLAAQISYSVIFSLFPFLLFLRALVAYFPGADRIGDLLLTGLADLVSTDSRLYQIVRDNIISEVSAVSSTLLSVGVVLTLWSASGAVMTLLKAVNRAYGLEETRSWVHRRLIAIALALAGAVVIPVGVALVVFGSWIGDLIGKEWGYDSFVHSMWVGLRWPVVIILATCLIGVFMHIAPNKRQRWYSTLPGAAFTVASGIIASIGLSWFLTQGLFQVRWLTYGAIGTAIVLLFWAFLCGLIVLVGGEINAVIARRVRLRQEASGRVAGEEGSAGLIESPDDE